MTGLRLIALTLVFTVTSLPLAGQERGPSLTLFSSGSALVRRTLPISIPAGQSTQQLMLGEFDAASFAVLEPGVQVDLLRYDGSFDETSLLRRNIGATFTLLPGEGRAPVKARLLALDPERWEILSGRDSTAAGVVFQRPGQILWNSELVPRAPVAEVTFTSSAAHRNLPVMYTAQGGSWGAGYRLFLGDAGEGRIEGNASIFAGRLDLDQAEVQLLAGEIGRKEQPSPRPQMMAVRAEADFSGQGISNEAVGEARLYTLPGRHSFTPGTQMVVPLFEPATVSPELVLTVPGALPFYGGFRQDGDEAEVPVVVSYRLKHEQGSEFGELALPAGDVTVYDVDSDGRVQQVGAGEIDHTAPGERIEIHTGTAFDVTARRIQTEYTTVRTEQPPRTTATVGYTVTLQNAKDVAVTVEVREDRGGEWSVISSSVPAVKRSSSRTVFMVPMSANGSAVLKYQLRVVW